MRNFVFKIETTFHVCADTRSKKKRCKIRFGVVCFIEQIGRAHRNRYKYYYFPGVIVLSSSELPCWKKPADKELFTLQTVIFMFYAQQRDIIKTNTIYIFLSLRVLSHIDHVLMILYKYIYGKAKKPIELRRMYIILKIVEFLRNFKGLHKTLYF